MSTMLTAQQFRAQFETRVEIASELREVMRFDQERLGYRIHRLLDRVVLEDQGEFYIHARPGEGE